MTAGVERFAGIGMTSARTRARMVERLREQGIRDEVVISAMEAVPRHIFVEEALAIRAYEDCPLPIGSGQTISQPYIVARMTELLRAGRDCRRCSKSAPGAVIRRRCWRTSPSEVYTVERIAALVAKARRNLRALKVENDAHQAWRRFERSRRGPGSRRHHRHRGGDQGAHGLAAAPPRRRSHGVAARHPR